MATHTQPSSNMNIHPGLSLNPLIFERGTATSNNNLQEQPAPPPSSADLVSPQVHQPEVSQKKFADIIIEVDHRLPTSKLKDVKYLCYDKVSDHHILENATRAIDILKDMSDYGSLDRTNVVLIAEMLQRIGLVSTMKKAFSGTNIKWSSKEISSSLDRFRCLLYGIMQQLPTAKLENLKKYCVTRDDLNIERHDLDEAKDFLDVFLLLEEQELIASDNIGLLKDFSENIFKNKKARELIENYESKMKKEGPVLSITADESERLLTLNNKQNITKDDLDKIFGADFYKKLFLSIRDESRSVVPGNQTAIPGPSVTPGGSGSGLITPSMITGGAVQRPSSYDEEMEVEYAENISPVQGQAALRSGIENNVPEDYEADAIEDDSESFTLYEDVHRESLRIPVYPMDAKIKGICLIISNEKFHRTSSNTEPSDRMGTEKDVENLHGVFSKLDFDVHVKRDLTANGICQELKKWRDHDHSSYNAFICCVLSHGNRGVVLGTDGVRVELANIIGYFKGNCRSLIGKPKIFIIQACQGVNWQKLTSQQIPRSPSGEAVGVGALSETLPEEVDILLLLSTIPGYKSARNKKRGSWFIMALTHILKKFPDVEIHSVMTILNGELSRAQGLDDDGKRVSQTALPSYTLRKLLFFKRP